MSAATLDTGRASGRLPGALRLGWARTGLELRLFARERQQVVFSFLYPVVMLVIFGSVFGDQEVAGGISLVRYFVPGIAATGIMLTSFQNLGVSIPLERDDGELARLQALGTPPVAYFLGKAGSVVVATAVQLTLLLAVARLLFGVPLPATALDWATFAWAGLLGATAGTVLGVAVSAVPRTAASATAIIAPIALVLQFFSGVFFVFSSLPGWMQQVAALFPLKWLTQAMRSAFLPDGAAAAEVAGSWERPEAALVLLAWTVGGLLVARRSFRWRQRG